MSSFRSMLGHPPLIAAILAAMLWQPALAKDCSEGSACQENPRFSAALTDFRVLQTGSSNRPLTATVRLHNKTDAPLTLVYVDGSAAAVDDQGHRYTMQHASRAVRGLGVATRREFDPRFKLAPGEAGDARIEVSAHIQGEYGTRFDFEFAVREVETLPGNQHRLGRETLLRYRGLQDGSGAAVAAASPAAAPAASAAGGSATADACQGRPNCVVNGQLVASIERLIAEAPSNNSQGIVVSVQLHNLSPAPMILTYKRSSGEMLDELGQRYVVDWRSNAEVKGIPISTHSSASSQFTLAPGESRRAQFRYSRYIGKTRLGSTFTPTLALEQYELLASNQLRLTREYALDFGPVAGGRSSAAGSGAAGDPAQGAAAVQQLLQGLDGLLNRD